MEFDYFYGQQADQFSFYRIPKVLFSESFWNVSSDAKLLYGILLDRMSLSAKNGWLDDKGRVYIIFTIEEIQEALNCGDKKATKMLSELESKCGLIERKRQGLGKPNLIYVKNFISDMDSVVERRIQNRHNDDSGVVLNTIQEPSKARCNNTDINNTEFSDTDSFYSSDYSGMENEGMRTRKQYEEYFREQLEFEILYERYPYERETLNEILELILDTVTSKRKEIRIASYDKPIAVVRSHFMKLGFEHISFVLDCLKKNTSEVRNIKQYLLATIYNAPLTISSYYDSLVRRD